MNFKLRVWWMAWLGMACAGRLLAEPGYHIDVWRADEGLPQGTVTSIAQTPDGYLWLGTQNGLVRFDGASFRVFNDKNTPALSNNRIVQLFVDRKGALWVGAEQGSLASLDHGNFTGHQMPGFGTAFNYARMFCDDPAGDLWIVSCEWQLLRWTQGVFSVPSTNWGLSGPDAVTSDPQGRVFIGTQRELAEWKDGKFQPLWSDASEAGFHVDFLVASQSGGCWVAANQRFRRFAADGWTEDRGSYAWTNAPIYGLHEDRRQRLWVATLGSGLFRYDPGGQVRHLTTRDGLPTDFVRCVTEDREGNIWVGTEGGGLCRLKTALFETLGVRQGLSSDQALSVCEARDGGYWIGMNGSGLDRLTNGGVAHFGAEAGLLNGHVWSVVQDSGGIVWAGTWGGLFKLEHGRFTKVSDGREIGGVILAMYETRDRTLWLGQQGLGALTQLKDDKRVLLRLPESSPSLDVRTMTQDASGAIWIGTQDDGLYRWQDGSTHFGRPEGLGSPTIWSLYADAAGAVWIGTCGGGLSRWSAGKLYTWTSRDGLVNDVICQILEDDRGNLWLGSYGGVFCVSKAEFERSATRGVTTRIHCASYGKADGLPSIECQGGFRPAGLKSRDGRLWFPTIKGLAVVDPSHVPTNPVPPIVMLEEMVVDGVVRHPGGATAAGTSPVVVEIQPGESNFEFHYTATSLTAPEKVRFRYRLKGLDADWIEAGNQRTITYSRLDPGAYEFQVKACNNDGVWNEGGAGLALKVLPRFWQTPWFVAAAIVVSLAGAAGLANFIGARRMRRRLEQAEREHAVERERRRIAQDMHDDLGSHLTEIALLSEFAQNPESALEAVQDDARKIMVKSRALTAALDEIVWAVDPENDSLESFVAYACSFAENYLRIARIACRLELPDQLPQVVLMTELRHNLFLTMKEALNNAVKHAQATEVRLRVGHSRGVLKVVIKDNGTGFVPAAVTNAKANASDGLTDHPHPRNGLANMRQRMTAIHGSCIWNSSSGQGTEVVLTVALEPK